MAVKYERRRNTSRAFKKSQKFARKERIVTDGTRREIFSCDNENGKKWLSPATLSKLSEALGVQPYKLFLEIEFDHENQNGFMSQFCTELSNDILGTIKAVYARYEERA